MVDCQNQMELADDVYGGSEVSRAEPSGEIFEDCDYLPLDDNDDETTRPVLVSDSSVEDQAGASPVRQPASEAGSEGSVPPPLPLGPLGVAALARERT